MSVAYYKNNLEDQFISSLRALLVRSRIGKIGTLIADELCGMSKLLQQEGEIIASINYYEAAKRIEESLYTIGNTYNI